MGNGAFWDNNKWGLQDVACQNWEKRQKLPLFRAKLPPLNVMTNDMALLPMTVTKLLE
jgi:hypothetical protein